jgi:hypothetical protein
MAGTVGACSGPRRKDLFARSVRQLACKTGDKRLDCPWIVVVQAEQLKFAIANEIWAAVGRM